HRELITSNTALLSNAAARIYERGGDRHSAFSLLDHDTTTGHLDRKAGGDLPVLCGPALAGVDGSMNPSESLRDVIGRGVELTACEAVAVAQQLIASR